MTEQTDRANAYALDHPGVVDVRRDPGGARVSELASERMSQRLREAPAERSEAER
jgi:hypothetical protein